MTDTSRSANPDSSTSKAVLYAVIMVMGMGQTVVFAIIPMLGRQIGLDQLVLSIPLLGIDFALRELAITSLTSMASLVFFLTAPRWGRRSDISGRKPIILLGLLGYAGGTLLFNGAGHLGLLGIAGGWLVYALMMASRVLLVSLMSATQPAASAYMVDITTAESRMKGMGRLAAANQLGTMSGPAMAYFAVLSLLAPLYIQAACCLLAALVVWRWLPESTSAITRARVVAKLRYNDPRYRQLLAIGLVMYIVMAMVQQTLGFYFQDKLQLDAVAAARQFSIAMVVSSSCMLVTQLAIVQRWRVHPLRLLQSGLPLTALGYLLLANASALNGLLGGMALFGVGMGLAAPGFSVSATFTVLPEEQGALAGLSASAPGMGFVIGPVIGALIYGIDPSLTYWCASLALLPLLLFVLTLSPQNLHR